MTSQSKSAHTEHSKLLPCEYSSFSDGFNGTFIFRHNSKYYKLSFSWKKRLANTIWKRQSATSSYIFNSLRMLQSFGCSFSIFIFTWRAMKEACKNGDIWKHITVHTAAPEYRFCLYVRTDTEKEIKKNEEIKLLFTHCDVNKKYFFGFFSYRTNNCV